MDGHPSTSKVAIPRLGIHAGTVRPKPPKARIPKACDHCRKRKIRCTGEPECRHCVDQNVPCVYSQVRRDRLVEATEQNGRLVALVKELSFHVDVSGQRLIDEHVDLLDAIDSIPPPSATSDDTTARRSRDAAPPAPVKPIRGSGEANHFDSVGNHDSDLLDENLLRSPESRATGFVGTNSSIQWMRSLRSQLGSAGSQRDQITTLHEYSLDSRIGATTRKADAAQTRSAQQEPPTSSQQSNTIHVSDSTFYLDREDVQLYDAAVDPYELPSPEVTEKLFRCYIQSVHTSFPILPYVFEDQFRRYNESVQQGRPYLVPDEWQAMLNLVLAIGAQYSRLAHNDRPARHQDHLIYMTRAVRLLGLDHITTSLPGPSESFIQSTGLLSLFYLTIGQISRAWMMIGTSLRFAVAAGLHLRNDYSSAMMTSTESLVRTWWSLHSIESLLCAIIGRPCTISNDECTVPLPRYIPKGESGGNASFRPSEPSRHGPPRGDIDTVTRSSFLGARVTIALIMQKALSKLYSPRTSANAWNSVQKDIATLMSELEAWAGGARSAGLDAESSSRKRMHRHVLLLDFHYQSTKLLICRPCLCRLEPREGQSRPSVDFDSKMGKVCVEAAQALTRLLPDEPDLLYVYEQGPWWCIVHNIMQAVAVFLLKMSLGHGHSTHRGEELSDNIKKLVRWLWCLSVSNEVAKRAYRVVVDIIITSGPRIQIDISDILAEEAGIFPPHVRDHPITDPSSSSFAFLLPASQHQSPTQHEWSDAHIDLSARTSDSGAHFSGSQQSAQDPQQLLFDLGFAMDANPSATMLGDPNLAGYDQPDSLFSSFLADHDANMGE